MVKHGFIADELLLQNLMSFKSLEPMYQDSFAELLLQSLLAPDKNASKSPLASMVLIKVSTSRICYGNFNVQHGYLPH